MPFKAGDFVERRGGYGSARFGRIVGPIRRDHDSWYVSIGEGIICCDYGADLSPLLEVREDQNSRR